MTMQSAQKVWPQFGWGTVTGCALDEEQIDKRGMRACGCVVMRDSHYLQTSGRVKREID